MQANISNPAAGAARRWRLAKRREKQKEQTAQEKLKQQRLQPHCEVDSGAATSSSSMDTETRAVPITNNPLAQLRLGKLDGDEDSNRRDPFGFEDVNSDTAGQAPHPWSEYLQTPEAMDDRRKCNRGDCACQSLEQTSGGESSDTESGQRPATASESASSPSTESEDAPIVKDPIDRLGKLQKERELHTGIELERIKEALLRFREQEEKRGEEMKKKEKKSFMEAVEEQAALEDAYEMQQKDWKVKMYRQYLKWEKGEEVALEKKKRQIMMRHLRRYRNVLLEHEQWILMMKNKLDAQNLEFLRQDKERETEIETAMKQASIGRSPQELWKAIQTRKILEMRVGVPPPKSKWVEDWEKHQEEDKKRREKRSRQQEEEQRRSICSGKIDMADLEQAVEDYRKEKKRQQYEGDSMKLQSSQWIIEEAKEHIRREQREGFEKR
jgi:hypothetical protein